MADPSLAKSWPRSREILVYYDRAQEALNVLRGHLRDSPPTSGPFLNLSNEELEEAFREMRRELDHEVVMLLAASFEAAFQVDLRERVRRKGPKSRLTKGLRNLWREHAKSGYVRIERILDVWKSEHADRKDAKDAIGRLNQLFQFRHWLAHGRYWNQKSGLGNVDPVDAYQIGKQVFDVLPGFEPVGTA